MGAILSAKEAAAAVGMTKAGLIKAIHRGQLSASKDIHGNWRIDSSELFRVFEARPAQLTSTPVSEEIVVHPLADTASTEVALLRELLAAKEDVIDDLRRRLDAEADERRRLTALITTTQPPAQPAPRVSLWRRLFPWWSHE